MYTKQRIIDNMKDIKQSAKEHALILKFYPEAEEVFLSNAYYALLKNIIDEQPESVIEVADVAKELEGIC